MHVGGANVVLTENVPLLLYRKGKLVMILSLVPHQASSNFHYGDDDKMFIDKFRKWLVNFQLHKGTLELQHVIQLEFSLFILSCYSLN